MTDTEIARINAICKVAHIDDIGDLSDGFHTFNDLYYQRCMLFAAIVKQNKAFAWKSHKHEDGEPCFGGGWFIVGVDTPEGSYTFHYEDKYWDMFDCKEIRTGKHWDGHTDKDVTRLFSLPMMPIDYEKYLKNNKCKGNCPAHNGINTGQRMVSRMDEIWVLQCRRTGETFATLFFYSNKDEAFREEENKKEDFNFVGLESWTTNWAEKPKTKVRKGKYAKTDFFCPRCLHLLGSHSKYCPECGKKLQW